MTQQQQNSRVRLKVSPEVARIVKDSPREVRIAAARGAMPLSGGDLLTTLLFLIHGGDGELRTLALETLRTLPAAVLAPTLADPQTHPRLLDLAARIRIDDPASMKPLLFNPMTDVDTLAHLASRAQGEVLSMLAHNDELLRSEPRLLQAIIDNPAADRVLKIRLGWGEDSCAQAEEDKMPDPEPSPPPEEKEDEEDAADLEEPTEEEEINRSKYQQALNMEVADKIKMALTGDKEWRSIFLKDPNKLVSSAVLKNPRITDGEVLAVAKNRSAHDELIRLITLNPEWVKNYEIQKALVCHPRTPLPKALRYMNVLTPKDLKNLSKSRGVSQVIVNNARRMVMSKDKNR